MSQEKVDRYKAEKKNRKKGMNPDRKTDIMINLFIAAVIIALSAFIIWSVYVTYFKEKTPQKTTYNLTSGEISRIIDNHKSKETENEVESDAETASDEANSSSDESNAGDDNVVTESSETSAE